MDNSKNLPKGSYREALRIWDIYAQIQKQIMDGDYSVKVDSYDVTLSGTVKNKDWMVTFILNINDRHTPSIVSENVVPWLGSKEIYTNSVFHRRSDEAKEKMEQKHGFEIKPVISLLGGGGDFPEKICEAIDEYDNAHGIDSFPTIEEVRDSINLEALARDTSQSLYGNILDWCRDRYNMPKVTFGTIAETLANEYKMSKTVNNL